MEIVHTNIEIYSAIATEAFAKMRRLNSEHVKPNTDGSGYIISYDPNYESLKSAMIVIVFTGMWLEALLHQEIVKRYSRSDFDKVDRNSYEEKLKMLGFNDEFLLKQVKRFRETRKELMHEKAYQDSGSIKTAQEEASLANEIMCVIAQQLARQHG